VRFRRPAGLLGLALVPAALALAAATAARPAEPADPSLLRTPGIEPEMSAFARRRRAAERRRLGVSPIRGPVDFGTEINRFGVARGGHVHGGQDVFAPTGTPLYAVHDAIVLEAGSDGGRGNFVILYAARARRTFVYMHMAGAAEVRPGRRVRAGRRVGRVGCTGSCDGAHLHFEVHAGRGARGRGIDPLPALKRWLGEADEARTVRS
jgi:murein DD-endopeptidase MepM/ murein hydrolase activator NlpD